MIIDVHGQRAPSQYHSVTQAFHSAQGNVASTETRTDNNQQTAHEAALFGYASIKFKIIMRKRYKDIARFYKESGDYIIRKPEALLVVLMRRNTS